MFFFDNSYFSKNMNNKHKNKNITKKKLKV